VALSSSSLKDVHYFTSKALTDVARWKIKVEFHNERGWVCFGIFPKKDLI